MTATEEQDRRIERYHALVDRKFGGSLTAEEAEEMERLGEEIDRFFAPFYQPIIEHLEAELEARANAARPAAQCGEA